MSRERRNLVGQKFGRWTVLEPSESKIYDGKEHYYWLCECECGTIRSVKEASLVAGTSQSCGCLHSEKMKTVGKYHTTHGLTDTKIYRAYKHMINRCYRENDKSYDNYGGRGITVCDEWRNSFEAFAAWAFANGFDQNASGTECTLDRIDVNGNYCPDNCRWVDVKAQANNRRSNKNYTFNGETHTIAEWAEKVGLPYKCLHKRLEIFGWGIERALTEPSMC